MTEAALLDVKYFVETEQCTLIMEAILCIQDSHFFFLYFICHVFQYHAARFWLCIWLDVTKIYDSKEAEQTMVVSEVASIPKPKESPPKKVNFAASVRFMQKFGDELQVRRKDPSTQNR